MDGAQVERGEKGKKKESRWCLFLSPFFPVMPSSSSAALNPPFLAWLGGESEGDSFIFHPLPLLPLLPRFEPLKGLLSFPPPPTVKLDGRRRCHAWKDKIGPPFLHAPLASVFGAGGGGWLLAA